MGLCKGQNTVKRQPRSGTPESAKKMTPIQKYTKMKKIMAIIALVLGTTCVLAQEAESSAGRQTCTLPGERIIPPYGIEVTYDKTVHIIFPAAIRYVDLGSQDLVAGKADGAENVLRVKAAVRNFSKETNMSVITESGSFYTFDVRYAEDPRQLNIEMKDFIHDGTAVNRPSNALDIQFRELGEESPKLVQLILRSIYRNNDRRIRNIDSRSFGIRFLLRGIYTHDGLLYFHTQIANSSNIPCDVDFITFKIVDRKVAKRTVIQEKVLLPLRACNPVRSVGSHRNECSVYALEKFTIPANKQLVIELHEKDGGRHQRLIIRSGDIMRAKPIERLEMR